MRVRVFVSSAALFAFSCLLRPAVAKADTYNFTIDGGGLTSSGTFTVANSAVNGAQQITGITGSVNNQAITGDSGDIAITGLAPITSTPYSTITFDTGLDNGMPSSFDFTYDNLLFPDASEPFDGYGLGFEAADGVYYNIAFDTLTNGLVYEAFNANLSFDQRTFNPPPVSVTLTDTNAVTPEPSSLLLLGTGLLAGTMLRRRRRLV